MDSGTKAWMSSLYSSHSVKHRSTYLRLAYVVLQGSLRLENYSAWAARVFPDGRRFTDR